MIEKVQQWKTGDRCLWFYDWGWEGHEEGQTVDDFWFSGKVTRVYQICLNGPGDYWDVVDVLLDTGQFHTAVWVTGIKPEKENEQRTET